MSWRMLGSVGTATVASYQGLKASVIASASLRKSSTKVSVLSGWIRLSRRQGLDRVEPDQGLVHEHRVQERLVVAGLELLGDDEHAVVGAGEGLGGLALGHAVHAGLGPVETAVADGAREGDQGLRVGVALRAM